MQCSKGQGHGSRGSHLTHGNPIRHGAEGRGGSLLLAAIPEGLKSLVLTGEQPPLAPLHSDKGGGSLLGPLVLSHQPSQAERFTRQWRQASAASLHQLCGSHRTASRAVDSGRVWGSGEAPVGQG